MPKKVKTLTHTQSHTLNGSDVHWNITVMGEKLQGTWGSCLAAQLCPQQHQSAGRAGRKNMQPGRVGTEIIPPENERTKVLKNETKTKLVQSIMN